MYPRHILPILLETLQDTPVILLNGARQTGKSTLAQHCLAGRPHRYLTLDDPVVLAAIKHDATGFIDGLEGTIILDEVQRAPEIFLAIKAAVDKQRIAGRFLLTGSANVLLLPNMADSLAGRMEICSLWPLSTAEIASEAHVNRADLLFNGDFRTLTLPPYERPELVQKLLSGGFPEVVNRVSERRKTAWFESYLQAILQRDVRDLAQVEQLTELPHLLKLLATRSASLLNFAELSRASNLPQTTLKRYFALLETLFLVYRLPSWERNPSKRLVKAPKVFLPDTGLLAYLCALSSNRLLVDTSLMGALVETFVFSELIKHIAFSEQRLSLWHYRTQNHIEIDFILEDRMGSITGIEVKASATVEAKDFKGLKHLQDTETTRFQRGIVLYAGRELVSFGSGLWAVPLSVWWGNLVV
ncbi:MAG: ATP-binding protein [Moraxellaceae bacterium]|nr:ATP-binding protein [Moraxellaceae bacterium]MCP5177379.1 ATP-binding protein [Moraxellaceae bacterium]HQV21913.1 ATP-binding protein [Agitococcus sp.]